MIPVLQFQERQARSSGPFSLELEHTAATTLTFAQLINEDAYQAQPAVSIPKKERVTMQVRQFGEILPGVAKAYGSGCDGPGPTGFGPTP